MKKTGSQQIKPIKLVCKKPLKELTRLHQIQMTQQARQELAAEAQQYTIHVMATANQIAKQAGRKRVTEDDILLAKKADLANARSEFIQTETLEKPDPEIDPQIVHVNRSLVWFLGIGFVIFAILYLSTVFGRLGL